MPHLNKEKVIEMFNRELERVGGKYRHQLGVSMTTEDQARSELALHYKLEILSGKYDDKASDSPTRKKRIKLRGGEIIIQNCGACPCCEPLNCMCQLAGRITPANDCYPNWCPLEDYQP